MLTAFATGTTDAAQAQGGGGLGMIIYLVVMVAIFYFILIRPQKKRQKQMANMLDALQVNDEIVTAGGVVGKVVTIKEDTVTVETSADRTKIKFHKSAIYTNNTANERMEAERKAAQEAKNAKAEKEYPFFENNK